MCLPQMIPLVGICLIFTLSNIATASQHCPSSHPQPRTAIELTGKSCDKLNPPQLSCYLPSDAEGGFRQHNFNTVQRAADIFSWQSLIALSWPVRQSAKQGEQCPKGEECLKDNHRVIWQTWETPDDVFLLNNADQVAKSTVGRSAMRFNIATQRIKPTFNYVKDFARPASPNKVSGYAATHAEVDTDYVAECEGDNALVLYDRAAKVNVKNILSADLQAAVPNGTLPATLTDQDGNITRYNIRMNPVMADYIRANKLNQPDVQIAAKSVEFPVGSIVIKTAWRKVDATNNSRFYTTTACVCRDFDDEKMEYHSCRVEQMGLTGMHIVSKTPSSPQWVWSTYEQVDNVAINHVRGANKTEQIPPSYYNPNCPTCPSNQQTPIGVPAQLKRLVPVPLADPNCQNEAASVDNIRELNLDVQAGISQSDNTSQIPSVFQYYELINTQWTTQRTYSPVYSHDSKTDIPAAIPKILSNLTMESYIEKTSTCVGCHSTARTLNPEKFVSSDFTFILSHNNLMSHPTRECHIDPPLKPTRKKVKGESEDKAQSRKEFVKWERAHWEKITRGYNLLNNTYEELPYYTGNKLHCTSCHLHGGGDSHAAWWVNSVTNANYPSTQNLQSRVNQCFERSMNGQALCHSNQDDDDDGNCKYNPHMVAIMTYMEWLNKKAKDVEFYPDHGKQKCSDYASKNGFPTERNAEGQLFNPFKTMDANHSKGQTVYVQKCAVCHGAEGEGRYGSGVYYRPALWGPHSFNYLASLARTNRMAAFVKDNMPLDSGGLLTMQEALDVAAFINECHCRPRRHLTTDAEPCELNPGCPLPVLSVQNQ